MRGDYKHHLVELQKAHSIAGRARVTAAVNLKDRLAKISGRSAYFVSIRRGAALGVCSAGESTNVTHVFQPSGRLSCANSQ
jgi:hypothetical protein